MISDKPVPELDDIDRQLIAASQKGLPLSAHPYGLLGEGIGLSEDEVIARMTRMLDSGIIRRMGAIPNHYALGFSYNGMTVWDVDESKISEIAPQIGSLSFVSHCYRRPRHLPDWSYNLFAMVHAKSKQDVEAYADQIKAILLPYLNGHDILYSKRILKKTGLRLNANAGTEKN